MSARASKAEKDRYSYSDDFNDDDDGKMTKQNIELGNIDFCLRYWFVCFFSFSFPFCFITELFVGPVDKGTNIQQITLSGQQVSFKSVQKMHHVFIYV